MLIFSKKYRIISLIAIIIICFNSKSYAYGKSEHVKIWQECFPGNPNLNAIYEIMSEIIDKESMGKNASDVWTKIYILSNGKFRVGRFSHRVFFHWGYNTRLTQTKCWQDIWTKQLIPGFSTKKDEVKKILINEWDKRKKRAEDIAAKKIKIKYVNSFCSLLYSIHILADYKSSQDNYVEAPLETIRDISEEMRCSINSIYEGDPKVQIILNKINKGKEAKCMEKTIAIEYLNTFKAVLPLMSKRLLVIFMQ